MILKNERLVETDDNIVDDDEIIVQVAPDEANKLFDLLFSSYSDARSAVIREYTSNCFDGHKANNNTAPVVVKIAEDDGGWYIEFIDKGIGMSADFIRTTFSQLLKSTKTHSNDAIGGYGIGSKSGLGYREQVNITTIYNNVKSDYLLYKETSGSPKILPISSENTEEHSGTTIKIYLNENAERRYSWDEEHQIFAKTAGKELAYFDNVVFDFEGYQLSNYMNSYNDGKIIETKTFKYRTDSQYSNETHLILGKVAYPIDWKLINIPRLDIPIGIKFEIGELQVNMTREAIRYSDETKELIKERLKEVKKELIEIYNRNNQPIESIFEYRKQLIAFKENREKYHITIKYSETEECKIDINQLRDELNAIKFKPTEHLPIELKDVNPYFFLYSNYKIENVYERKNGDNIYKIHNYKPTLVYINNKEPTSKEFRKYIQNCLYVRERKIHYKTEYNNIIELLGISKHQIGKAKIIHEYKRIIKEELKKECKTWIDYDSFEIPQSWKEEQKRLAKFNRVDKPKIEGKVSVRDLLKERTYDFDLATLNNYTGILIYGFLENKELFEGIQKLLEYKRTFNELDSKRIQILRIARNNEKFFSQFTNITSITKFMETNNRILAQLLIGFELQDKYKELFSDFKTMDTIESLNRYVHKSLIKIKKYYSTKFNSKLMDFKSYYPKVYEQLKENQKLYNIDDSSIRPTIQYLDNYFKDCELLFHLDYSKTNSDIIINYMKKMGKKVNYEHYNNSNKPQKKIDNSLPSFPSFGLILQPFEDLTTYNPNKPCLRIPTH